MCACVRLCRFFFGEEEGGGGAAETMTTRVKKVLTNQVLNLPC